MRILYSPRKVRVVLRILQIGIEDHTDIADQYPSARFDADRIGGDINETIICHRLHAPQLRCEIGPERDAIPRLNSGEVDSEIADQMVDDVAPQAVLVGQLDTGRDRKITRVDLLVVFVQSFRVLRITIVDLANSAHAEPDQITFAVGGIALKIARHRLRVVCMREFVRGFREMVHPDVDISRGQQFFDTVLQDLDLGLGRREQLLIDLALGFEPRGQVGVIEYRGPVRPRSRYQPSD